MNFEVEQHLFICILFISIDDSVTNEESIDRIMIPVEGTNGAAAIGVIAHRPDSNNNNNTSRTLFVVATLAIVDSTRAATMIDERKNMMFIRSVRNADRNLVITSNGLIEMVPDR